MTHEERNALRRVLRMLDAAGGVIHLPERGALWPSPIEPAIKWVIRNDPPTPKTQKLIRQHRERQEARAHLDRVQYANRNMMLYRSQSVGRVLAAAARAFMSDPPAAEEPTP